MKRISLILFMIFLMSQMFAQSLQKDFRLDSTNSFEDVEQFHASNSIEEIISPGDTIWIATTKGVSKSGDNGITWINYGQEPEFDGEPTSLVKYNNGMVFTATWNMEEFLNEDLPVGSGLRISRDNGIFWDVIPQPRDSLWDSTISYGNNILRAMPIATAVYNLTYDIGFSEGTIWTTNRAGGLRKSTDNGQTWERVVLPPDYLNEITPSGTYDFDLSPSGGNLGMENNLNHQAFSILVTDENTIYVGTAGGINKSTDNGISWEKFNHLNQDSPISGNFIIELAHNKADNSIWAATWRAEGLTEYTAISSSHDGGETWQTYLPGEKSHCFGFKYEYENEVITGADIFVATESGIFRSLDDGKSWILSPSIIDSETGAGMVTKNFRAIDCNLQSDGTTDLWFGTINGLILTNEIDGMGWSGDWKIFLASKPLASVNESYTFPNPFHPGRDVSVTRFKYSTRGNSSEVTIRVFDFGMNLVRTIIQNVTRRFTKDDTPVDYWDGRDDKGRIVPNGAYFYRIDIDSNDPLYGKILVVR